MINNKQRYKTITKLKQKYYNQKLFNEFVELASRIVCENKELL